MSNKETNIALRPEQFFKYSMSIAKEFESRLSRMQVFVKHNLSSGTANEVILREFLSSHAPKRFHVGQGFICDPYEEGRVSRQCDILIYDQERFPLVYSDGPIKIVWPQAAEVAIEVKTNFHKDDITTALDNISSAKRLDENLTGIIFAFKSPRRTETIFKHLGSYSDHPLENGPTAILLLDKGMIIHRWGWLRGRDMDSTSETDPKAYGVRVGKRDKSAVVITFLLLLFFAVLGRATMALEADSINTLFDLFDQYTEKRPDIYIGGC